MPDKTGFEEALSALEERVRKLESGEIGLEEALALFEEGVALARTCHEHLEAVSLKQNAHPFTHRLLIINDQHAESLVHDAREAWRTGGNVTRKVVPCPGCECTSIDAL